MNARQIKKILQKRDGKTKQRRRTLIQKADAKSFDEYANTPNGSARLVAFHDAVADADDTLEAVDRAICDGDLAEASKLLALGRESLADRLTELKELL